MIQRLPSALPLGSLLLPVLSLVVLVVFFGGDPGLHWPASVPAEWPR